MALRPHFKPALGFATAACLFSGMAVANAASLLNTSGNVALGVDAYGQLDVSDPYDLASNIPGVLGIARVPAPGDATAPGCLCEGWGVSATVAATPTSGWANNNFGVFGLTSDSFTSDDDGITGPGTFATSAVHMTGTGVSVTQEYAQAAATPLAFRDLVTIKNGEASTITDVRYVRVMDWDVPPTEFSEFVTIKGTGTTTELELSHDDGFEPSDPLAATSELTAGTTLVDFDKVGPSDHGAYFKFNFGSLDAGESKQFEVYYGAGKDEAEALAALALIGPELYSLGYSSGGGVADVSSAVYFFAFKGVGGTIITPGVPDGGATLTLLGGGIVGLLGFARRRSHR